MLSFTWFVMIVACDGRRIFWDSRRASCSWSVVGRWICICVELNRRDYELIIISRSSIYGSVDHKRSAIEISLTLSFTYQESGLIEVFLEVLECGEVPVWWVGCWICFLQRGCIIDETLGVRWDGYGIHMVWWLERRNKALYLFTFVFWKVGRLCIYDGTDWIGRNGLA